jgi:DNA ligase (NAD+)
MASDEVLKRYYNLIDEITKHDNAYYVKEEPLISDYEYDRLMKELKEIESTYPEVVVPYSPSFRVGHRPVGSINTRGHEIRMLSLDNTYSHEEVEEFLIRVNKKLGLPFTLVLEPKIDGVAISLIYENGYLVYGITRGDGYVGEDVTHNIKTIKSLPLKINNTDHMLIRGEVYLNIKDFERINSERLEKELPPFANPRNAAAGTLKLLDPKVAFERNLDIFIYALDMGRQFETHYDDLICLKEMGFKVNPHIKKAEKQQDKIFSYLDNLYEIKKNLEYAIDGAVIKINEYKYRNILGETAKYPRWAIAFKYPPEQRSTMLIDVKFQVGRTGIITPVAILEPINISGSVVSKATLHNIDEIKRLNVKIGDYVFVEKAGEIIPKIVKVIKERRSGMERDIAIPTRCPFCESIVIKEEGNPFCYCINPECPARIKASILHFTSRDAMDIKGFGESLVDKSLKSGKIKTIADIYDLKKEDAKQLERMGEKSAENIIESIKKSKEKPFPRVLYALGLRHIGVKYAQILAEHFKNIDNLMKATVEDFEKIEGIGNVIAETLYKTFREKRIIEIIDRLRKKGLKFSVEEPNFIGKLARLTFVITGSLSKPRSEIINVIEMKGGKVVNTVSDKVDYLIVGKEPGSKLIKAKDLNINIIEEEDLYNMIKNNKNS